jgi:hypothetical protein
MIYYKMDLTLTDMQTLTNLARRSLSVTVIVTIIYSKSIASGRLNHDGLVVIYQHHFKKKKV